MIWNRTSSSTQPKDNAFFFIQFQYANLQIPIGLVSFNIEGEDQVYVLL